MQTFNLKSAKEVTAIALASDDQAQIKAAYDYAQSKLEALQAKDKAFRAKLWLKALEQIEPALQSSIREEIAETDQAAAREPEPIAERVNGSDFERRYRDWIDNRDQRCEANGLKKMKRGGITIWRRPLEYWNHTANGVNPPTARAREAAIAEIMGG